ELHDDAPTHLLTAATHIMRSNQTTRRAGGRKALGALLLTTIVFATACNKLLDVSNPGRVPVEALDDPALMPTLEAAALQQFQCGFAQFVATGGMLSGEYLSANAFVDNHPWEWRGMVEIKGAPGSCPGANARTVTSMGFYTPLQQARFQLEDASARLEKFTDAQVPNRQKMLTEFAAYAGYAYAILAEGMCEMAIDNGPKMTRAQVLAIAEKRFTTAIALATTLGDASLRNMATVGRARVRLDLNNLAGAAADAALVPAGFVRNAEYSETTPARENRLYNLSVRSDFISVGPDYRNLTVNGVPDPRVKVNDMKRVGADNATPIWQQQKFIAGAGAVPLPIASYAEAQLILAEASGGQVAVDAINRVRALSGVAPMPAPAPGTDMTAIVLEERRRQLFSEGLRYADMNRKGLPFLPAAGTANRKSQIFGAVTCVPLPDVETLNNPNFK
ncbi:MAG: RagB/SusD protein, partial [Gemmatimonadetes bacterium]|nr:RagB/SusD protein [Gemmatimonadota bacterium]